MLRNHLLTAAIKAEARSDSWWDALNRREQQAYVKAHPHSKYARMVKTETAPAPQTDDLAAPNFTYNTDLPNQHVASTWHKLFKQKPTEFVHSLSQGLDPLKIFFNPDGKDSAYLRAYNKSFTAERELVQTKDGL